MSDARAIAEETARASYGRLLAWLCSRTGDVAQAEDALADAFRAALENWPRSGAPASPEAWIITAARRKLIDNARRATTRNAALNDLLLAAEEAESKSQSETPFPDERLKLLFICAHPAIDQSIRTPLMLQTVLGLDAARIASAFLTSPNAMSARLVRAKRKIKKAAVPFVEPALENLNDRLVAVLDAIYAAFGAGWDALDSAQGGDLTGEALFLAKLLTDLLPDQPEAWGLLSLMAHAEARRDARRVEGAYVPLSDQDISLWDRELIVFAEQSLARAWEFRRPGRYQLEAAIQSAHATSRIAERDVTPDIIALYESLLQVAPSVGAEIGYAAALANANRPRDGLARLDGIDASLIEAHQPFWAVRAHILKSLGQKELADVAFDRAIGLSTDDSSRQFLATKKTARTSWV
ncbi:RNA polymerase sigma factor [Hyphococcus sp.]|uniref:RNA polymerase sigma factor n=1 Tax=Hyphococcus sp. TaxID=2038636 RepID=UPI0020832C44|nr:MAG: DNA-directed RNA polymerase sigma-70 factor [Marinicaulis sp.]